jgi:hypothetical protein
MDKSSSTISIAMEFCEGGSLDSVYKEVKKLGGRTGEKVLGKVAEGVLHGLTYLNSRKIIHRGMFAVSLDESLADCFCRHQAFEYSALSRWPSQTLRFWGQWRIWHQRRRQYLHWNIILHGAREDTGPILHHHLGCLVVGGNAARSCTTSLSIPCRWY